MLLLFEPSSKERLPLVLFQEDREIFALLLDHLEPGPGVVNEDISRGDGDDLGEQMLGLV